MSDTTKLTLNGGTKIPASLLTVLVSAVVAGGGVGLGGWSVREGLVRLEGQVQALRDEVRPALSRSEARFDAMDARLRAVELETARSHVPTPR